MNLRNVDANSMAVSPAVRERLLAEWHSLSTEEQDAVFDDFREAIYFGPDEPSAHWYPLFAKWC